MKKRILVTGGAGFIGSNLCKRLVDQGRMVVAVDDLSTGSEDNVAALKSTLFSLVVADVSREIVGNFDCVVNLACPASPIWYQMDPIKTLKTSVLGSLNLLDYAHKTGARIIQASTSEVYGDPVQHPQTEEYWGNVNCTGIRACYDEGKRAAETLFFDYHRQYNVDMTVLRIFNTFGPNMAVNDGRVVSNFIVQALLGKPITMYGNGLQTRSFCYVDDMVDAIIKTIDMPQLYPGPINVGNPEEFTLIQLADLIISLTKSTSEVIFVPLPQDDPTRRKPDISRARQFLGWQPTTSLREGLEKTIAFFRQQVSVCQYAQNKKYEELNL